MVGHEAGARARAVVDAARVGGAGVHAVGARGVVGGLDVRRRVASAAQDPECDAEQRRV